MNPLTIAKLWLLIRPIDRIRLARAQRRARKAGLPEPTSLENGGVVFPQGTQTKSGIILMIIGAAVSIGLTLLGVKECSPEQIAEGCQGVSQLSPVITQAIGALIGAGGAILSWKGYNRAKAGYPQK